MKPPVQLTTPHGPAYVWTETLVMVGCAFMDYDLLPVAALVRCVSLRGGHDVTILDTPENLTKLGVA